MADVLKLEIVTPTGIAFAHDVLEVDVPTLSGEIGVLPGHVPLLAAVRTGLVTYRSTSERSAEPSSFAIAHGVFEITGTKALLLTERFLKKEQVDVVKVRARFREVGEELAAWTGDPLDPKRLTLVEEEQWLAAQLELVGDPPPPRVHELTRFQVKPHEDIVPAEETDQQQ
ncbi:MAG: F0F1 ATP synthase subunit epsilon [Polyangiaceae bacterium]